MLRQLASISFAGIVFTAAYAAVIWAIFSGPAYPHEAPTGWTYPISCCWSPSNAPAGIRGDCSEIPDHAVREGPDGYGVTLRPGEHPQVDRRISFTFPYAAAKVAPDGGYHVCLRPHTLEPRCFFAGARGS